MIEGVSYSRICRWAMTQVIAISMLAPVAFGQVTPATAKGPVESDSPIPEVKKEPIPARPSLKFADRDSAYVRNIKDFAPLQNEGDNKDEFDAYNNLILHSKQFTAEETLKAARKDVSYNDLLIKDRGDREYLRFELIRFEGRMIRLKKLPANAYLEERGIREMYEAWIYPTNQSNPICLLLHECPAGLEPNQLYQPAPEVSVGGYFFKVIEFQTDEKASKPGGIMMRRAPFLIAPSVIVQPSYFVESGSSWRNGFLPAVLTGIGLISLFAVGVTWYFRRGDKKYKKVVESKRVNPFDDTTPSEPPVEGENSSNFPWDRGTP